ncbi:MAG TPA: OsmC family protein [Candidatus Sulfotelmatobacter sp.]|jgi:organic hydroperoxide reductase OsmC/OhrA|nr:OsmC family protein [Candidatus Sulfotelmatobacter sp.]
MAAEYYYRASAWWTYGRSGLAKCDSSPNTIHFSEAAELGGLADRWTPEQLLLCALAGCFTTTFHNLAHIAKFDYTDLEVEIEGCVRGGRTAGTSFNDILIRPRLTLASEEQRETGLALLRRAKTASIISRAVAIPQTLDPQVEILRPPWVDFSSPHTAAKLEV